jgi:hypothetical protein
MTSKFIKTALMGLTLVLGAAQSAQADGIFTVASILGKYAYANSGGDVASFGPMRFDGRGGVSFAIKVNVACATPGPSCQRTISISRLLAPTRLTRTGRVLLRLRSHLAARGKLISSSLRLRGTEKNS